MIQILSKQNKAHYRFALPLLIIGVVFGIFIGRAWTQAQASTLPISGSYSASGTVVGIGKTPPSDIVYQDVEFRQFWDIWRLLKDKYYKQPISEKELFYGAMQGLAAGLNDPYTHYFPPVDAEEFQKALSGKFSGIGAEIGVRNDHLTIIAPLPESPAEKSGVKSGDLITAVDSVDTTGWSVEEAVSKIRGEKGTDVVLSIYREKADKPSFDVTIMRDEIQIKSVKSEELDHGIIKIDVTNFNEDTRAGFDTAVRDAAQKNPKGIILDLRGNPGGFLDTALFMAGEWVGEDVVVKERRQGEIVETLKGTGHGRFAGISTVVLVNGGSASASEIVAGALQDYGLAMIVGEKTFGKGSVQDYVNLPDGSALKVTIAEWLTPKEHTINGTGLEPDLVIERTTADYEQQIDPQLDRAIGILDGTAPAPAKDKAGE